MTERALDGLSRRKKCSENYCKCEQKAQTEIVSNLNALQIDINIVLALFILVEDLIVLE